MSEMGDEPIIDVTKVSDKGQVVIPKEIRDKLKFTEGSKLIVVATEDAVILQRIESVAGKVRIREILERIKAVTERLGFRQTS
ncbi:MAG: AbrB/MazE/SpoVT family DNA-binding domain-containing protein [Thaumarchaeota archaeon]|nr:AbrB/MazE/SpoVT family DNA-binding domain-containing protein [Nitrososphaerota archaeon]